MADDFAVNPEVLQRGRYGVASATPDDSSEASMVANITGLPPSLFEKYSKGPTATLMPADPTKGYATPYYAAYTNDGGFAGAVMVAPGQKVRLVDKMTGDVVFEGIGPEGAQLATSAANAISRDLGRTAAWAIQKPTDEGGWVSMAEERWDPKKQSALGKLADFALPILGAILMPVTGGMSAFLAAGLGSAAGSALSSVAQGRPLDETLKRAAIAGVTAGVGAKVAPMLGKALAASESPAGQALSQAYSKVMNPLNAGTTAVRGAAGNVGNVIGDVFDAAGNLIVRGGGSAATSATGGALGSIGGGMAANTLTGSGGQNVMQGGTGADTVGNTVEGVDVTASNADATSGGVLGSALSNPITVGDYTKAGGDYTAVDQLTVNPTNDSLTGGAIGSSVADLDPTQIARGVEKGVDYKPPTDDELLTPEPKSLADKALDWVKANPLDAAKLGLTLVGGGAAAASGGGTGGGGIPPGFETAGTPGSLSDIFRAKLPAPSGPFADLSARNVALTPEQWKTYGQRSEQSFFNNVPQRPSGILDTSRRAPPMPLPEPEPGFRANVSQRFTRPDGSVEVVNGDERMVFDSAADADAHEAKQAAWRATLGQASQAPAASPLGVASSTPASGGPKFTGPAPYEAGVYNQAPTSPAPFREVVVRPLPMPAPSAEPERFAKGGFAVRGMGSGRDDKIPARLSDGEYVMDAETVALLGDGSSDAGAKRLDAFRANIRKHKGKKLARGEFSVNAKKPEAYLKGGRA